LARVDLKNKAIQAKLVYYGPGLCGKTTNLQYINARLAKDQELMSLATEGDRTIFFDFMPLDLGKLRGLDVNFKLYTVPGQVRYNETRKMVLKNVDGVVFVADSQEQMIDANLESIDNLYSNLEELGIDPKSIPIVLQYNKRDLPNVMSISDLDKALNQNRYPTFEACAMSGEGVVETLRETTRLVITSLATSLPEQDQKSVRGRHLAPGSQKLGVGAAPGARTDKAAPVPKAAEAAERAAPDKAAAVPKAGAAPDRTAPDKAADVSKAARAADRTALEKAAAVLRAAAAPDRTAPDKAADVPKAAAAAGRTAPEKAASPQVAVGKLPLGAPSPVASAEPSSRAAQRAPGPVDAAGHSPARTAPDGSSPVEHPAGRAAPTATGGPTVRSAKAEIGQALQAERSAAGAAGAAPGNPPPTPTGAALVPQATLPLEPARSTTPLQNADSPKGSSPGVELAAVLAQSTEALKTLNAELARLAASRSNAHAGAAASLATKDDLEAVSRRVEELAVEATKSERDPGQLDELRHGLRQVAASRQDLGKILVSLDQLSHRVAQRARQPEDALGKSDFDALQQRMVELAAKMEVAGPRAGTEQPVTPADLNRLDERMAQLVARASLEIRAASSKSMDSAISRMDELREAVAGLARRPVGANAQPLPLDGLEQARGGLASKADLDALVQKIAQLPTKSELQTVAGLADAMNAMAKRLDALHQELALRGGKSTAEGSASLVHESVTRAIEGLASRADVEKLREIMAGLGPSQTGAHSAEISPEGFKQLTESLASKAELRALAQRIAQLPTKGELESLVGQGEGMTGIAQRLESLEQQLTHERGTNAVSASAMGEVVAQAVEALASKADLRELQGKLDRQGNASAFEKLSARIERLTEGLDALGRRVEQLAEGSASSSGRVRHDGPGKPSPEQESGVGKEESLPIEPIRTSVRASAPSDQALALPQDDQPQETAPPLLTGPPEQLASTEPGPASAGEPAQAAAVESVGDTSSRQESAARSASTPAGSAESEPAERSLEARVLEPDEQQVGPTDAHGGTGPAGEAATPEIADAKDEISDEASAPAAPQSASHATETTPAATEKAPATSGESARPDEPSPQLAEDPFVSDPEHQNAKRIARVMVADLYLYQRDAVEEGIRSDDFFERNKDALADMRDTYASRVPQESCREQDYLGKAITEFIKKKRAQLGIS
jgi:signal recognition particle receptor subunit beta